MAERKPNTCINCDSTLILDSALGVLICKNKICNFKTKATTNKSEIEINDQVEEKSSYLNNNLIMKNLKLFSRWVFAFPISIFAALLIMFPIHWYLLYYYGTTVSCEGSSFVFAFRCYISIETVERTIQSILMPFMIIKITSMIIPNFKFYIVCFLSLIFGFGLSIIRLTAQLKGGFTILDVDIYRDNWLIFIVVFLGFNFVIYINLIFEYREFKSKI